MAKVGDYVLAAKWVDGGPMYHFAIGIVVEIRNGRYTVVGGDGEPFRRNGFRRAEPITLDEGRQLLEIFPDISDRPGLSLWDHLARLRGEETECINS